MKVASSAISINAQFPTLIEQAREEIEAARSKAGKGVELDELLWNWVWVPRAEPKPPRSWSALLKADAKAHVVAGMGKGYASARLEARTGSKKVWCSGELRLEKAPEELWRELARRSNPFLAQSGWTGPTLEVYQPMHQRHPGLAEHALMGAIEVGGKRLHLLCDRPDPRNAAQWAVFGIDAGCAKAWSELRVFDRDAQKAFEAAGAQGVFEWNGEQALRVADAQVIEALGECRRLSWTFAECLEADPIPDCARRFKLGEEVLEVERKTMTDRERRALRGEAAAPKAAARR